jgi:tetratricopeptide (TPR) repeat protein
LNKRAKNTVGMILISQAILFLIIPAVISAEEIKQQILDALNAGDTTSAISLLNNDIKLDPSYEYNYYMLGQIYEKRRQWNEALAQYQIALDKKSKFYEGLYALGLVQLKLEMTDEAEKSFQKGLKKSRDMKAQFHNGMGLVYLARGECKLRQ